MKALFSIITLSIFLSGVPILAQSKYQQLQSDYNQLESRVEALEATVERLTNLLMAETQDSPDVVGQKPPPVMYPGNKDDFGDKGVEEGTLDTRALYGKMGGGGGSSLDMAGWRSDSEPRPDDTSSESGKIVFEIKIDDKGKVVSVKNLESSVSSTIAQLYQKEVEQLTFSKTSNSTSAPRSTTGKLTFIIKAK